MHAHIAAAGGIWGAPVHVHVYSLCFKGAPHLHKRIPGGKWVMEDHRASPLGASLERR